MSDHALLEGHFKCVAQIGVKEYLIVFVFLAASQLFVNTQPKEREMKVQT